MEWDSQLPNNPQSCQQRFTSLLRYTNWHFSLKWVTSCKGPQFLQCFANILPCGSVCFVLVFCFWQWFCMKGAVCLDACGPIAWIHRGDSRSQTSTMSLIDFQGNLRSFRRRCWVTSTKTAPISSSITLFRLWHVHVNSVVWCQSWLSSHKEQHITRCVEAGMILTTV